MNELIQFPGKKPSKVTNVITDDPLKMRWGAWRTQNILQVHKEAASKYEEYRERQLALKQDHSGKMPAHIPLTDGLHETGLAMLRFRNDKKTLIKVGYLAACMETLVNTPCEILRTDLIRRVYNEVENLSNSLNLHWKGKASRFMLPLMEDHADMAQFKNRVAPLNRLKVLFLTLQEIAEERFEKLTQDYVLYYPRKFTINS